MNTHTPNNESELDEILTRLENQVSIDTAHRITSHKNGRSPKTIHQEAKQALLSWRDSAVVEAELQARANAYYEAV